MSSYLRVTLAGVWFVCGLSSFNNRVAAQDDVINYDEAKVAAYVLPDPLAAADGRPVTSAEAWQHQRRAAILELFRANVYGRPLPKPSALRFEVAEDTPPPLAGWAVRKRVRIRLPEDDELGRQHKDGDPAWNGILLTLIVPRGVNGPVPAFLGMHLFDSASDNPLPGVHLENSGSEDLPGGRLMQVVLEAGYAVGTLDAKDVCPDDAQRYREGVLQHFDRQRSGPPGPEEPGAISVWAWALSRALDFLETDPAIDAHRVAVIGHSRMGKTALWAGAQDERFAIVISNNSGCGGAALSRRNYGETVSSITRRFPHWFCSNFTGFGGRENTLPVDQHELIALAAPRPVYIASAEGDRWADPRGEFLAAVAADPVFRLLGKNGLGVTELPPIGKSIGGSIGYHLRVGKHALTDYDWARYLEFADRHFGKTRQAKGD
ncbi:MAG TPA: acetylxylan esterase [Pirellulales bacterium]|nr:acetylxylan esterase [Pirellulales bacterium]